MWGWYFHYVSTFSWYPYKIKVQRFSVAHKNRRLLCHMPSLLCTVICAQVNTGAGGCEDYGQWDYIRLYPADATFDAGCLLFLSPTKAIAHLTKFIISRDERIHTGIMVMSNKSLLSSCDDQTNKWKEVWVWVPFNDIYLFLYLGLQ